MAVEQLDVSGVLQKASAHIWDSILEYNIKHDRPPSMEQARAFFEQGIRMLLDFLAEPGAKVDDHLTLTLRDVSDEQDLSQVAIDLDAKTDVGQTIVALFSSDPTQTKTAGFVQ